MRKDEVSFQGSSVHLKKKKKAIKGLEKGAVTHEHWDVSVLANLPLNT